eukprot:3035110-Pyramimonas_sp.AAC.1
MTKRIKGLCRHASQCILRQPQPKWFAKLDLHLPTREGAEEEEEDEEDEAEDDEDYDLEEEGAEEEVPRAGDEVVDDSCGDEKGKMAKSKAAPSKPDAKVNIRPASAAAAAIQVKRPIAEVKVTDDMPEYDYGFDAEATQ